MPTAVAAARQSYADHPMVRLETAPPGPCHAVSLQETLSGTFTACATVILDSVQPSNCMGNGPAMRASVLLSLTGKDGNDGNLHREDDFRFHTSVQRWTDDIP